MSSTQWLISLLCKFKNITYISKVTQGRLLYLPHILKTAVYKKKQQLSLECEMSFPFIVGCNVLWMLSFELVMVLCHETWRIMGVWPRQLPLPGGWGSLQQQCYSNLSLNVVYHKLPNNYVGFGVLHSPNQRYIWDCATYTTKLF